MNREYCVKRRSETPGWMDSGLPYCSSTEADLRRMKRELYSPDGSTAREGFYPMERNMLHPPQRSFSPDVQQICFPRARRDILSIEREIDERSWTALEGRMRTPPEFPGQAFSSPRSKNTTEESKWPSICNSGQIGIYSSIRLHQNTEWDQSRIMSGREWQLINMTETCEFYNFLFLYIFTNASK